MIDLDVLDRFATGHLEFEAACSRCARNPSISSPPTDAEVTCGLDQIRDLIMNGSIDEACEICAKLCFNPIDDPRVQINIRIHKLYELIHSAENIPKDKPALRTEALQKALLYSQELASFALDAFPEAYPMFIESMMLFAYPERTSTADAIHQRRKSLADNLVSLTRLTVFARESKLSFLIRYLLLIYIQFKSPVRTPGVPLHPMDELIRELLDDNEVSVDRPSRISWKTDGTRPTKFGNRDEYREIDVQALPERVSISRQESIESLRFARGNVAVALKNELGRILVKNTRFRQLVIEYCAARGLKVFEIAQADSTSGIGDRYPMISDEHDRVIIPRGTLSPSSMKMFSVMRKLRMLVQSKDFDTLLAAIEEDADLLQHAPLLEFRIGQGRVLRFLQKEEYDSALNIVQQKLGPLAGKCPELHSALAETTTLLVFASDMKSVWQASPPSHMTRDTGLEPGDAETTSLPQADRAGDKRIRHSRPRERGTIGDLPHVQSFDNFLAQAVHAVAENASLECISAQAYKAHEKNFKKPDLIQLLELLIPVHEEWQAQNMMTDKFSNAMGIDELRGSFDEDKESAKNDQDASHISGTHQGGGQEGHGSTTNSGSLRNDRAVRRDEQRESTVLTLMEFLAISRAEALAIVRNHPHADNAQTILDSLLGSML